MLVMLVTFVTLVMLVILVMLVMLPDRVVSCSPPIRAFLCLYYADFALLHNNRGINRSYIKKYM
ncbi:hypothetical protein D3C77_813450 [compost metagenome]